MGKPAPFLKTTFYTRTIPGLVVCFQALKQSPWSHAIFFLSCRWLDLMGGQKASGCLRLQMTQFFSLDGTFFSCSLFADWDWFCSESDRSRFLVASGEVSVIVARGFNSRLGFDLGSLCFLFPSAYMKFSRGLNSVSTRLRTRRGLGWWWWWWCGGGGGGVNLVTTILFRGYRNTVRR